MTGTRNAALLIALCCAVAVATTAAPAAADDGNVSEVMDLVDGVLDAADTCRLAPGVRVVRSATVAQTDDDATAATDREHDPEKYLVDRIARYAGTHVLDVDFAELFRSTGRSLFSLREYTA